MSVDVGVPAAGAIRVLTEGRAAGPVLVLTEPLSFMGGVDPGSGLIIDNHHPQFGQSLQGTVLITPGSRGSSGTSPVLLESLRNGTGPAAIVLTRYSPILHVGALVARELYGYTFPLVLTAPAVVSGLTDNERVDLRALGRYAELLAPGTIANQRLW